MNTSATLAFLQNRLAHVTHDLQAERNALRNGYGYVSIVQRLDGKRQRLARAVSYLNVRRAKQQGVYTGKVQP